MWESCPSTEDDIIDRDLKIIMFSCCARMMQQLAGTDEPRRMDISKSDSVDESKNVASSSTSHRWGGLVLHTFMSLSACLEIFVR